MPPGRLPTYTATVAADICRRLASGESLRGICRDEGFPPESTVREWVIDDREGFAARYARARELQMEAWADEILEIADDGSNDWMEKRAKDGSVEGVVNHEHVTRSRLRVDTKKWLLSKIAAKTYGDKLQHANAAGDGNQVTEVIYRWSDPGDEG